MSIPQPLGPPQVWCIRATLLPNGTAQETWWFDQGQLARTPVANAVVLPGNYLLPGGLVDAHTHLTLDSANCGLVRGSEALIAANWQRQLASGVLNLRDAGLTPMAGVLSTPFSGRVLPAGRIFAPPGRYHRGIGEWVPPTGLVAAALGEVALGVTWVNFIADFPDAAGDWFNASANYDLALIRKLVRHVHAAGARVMAYTTGPIANELVRLGVDSIEHGARLTATTVRQMADQGTAWTPTVWTMMKNVGPALTLPEPISGDLRAILEALPATLALAAELGVTLLAGSDEAPHGSLPRELQALHDFGLSAPQILASATSTARRYLHLPPAATTADFVTYWDDPRSNLATLAEPAAIVVDGVRLIPTA